MTVTNDDATWEEAADDDGAAPQLADQLSLEEQLAAAQAEAARNLDGWQRTQAEFSNARKRFEKQRVETYVNANADMVGRLVPLMDDFERALEAMPEASRANPWVTGVELVYRKMQAILEEMNVQVIPAVGEPFDPNLHEALSQEASDEFASGTVVREMRRGYRLGERVIRPSLVTVAP